MILSDPEFSTHNSERINREGSGVPLPHLVCGEQQQLPQGSFPMLSPSLSQYLPLTRPSGFPLLCIPRTESPQGCQPSSGLA